MFFMPQLLLVVPCATSGTRTIPGAVTTTTVGRTPQLGTVSLPAVTPQIRDKIISGEFVDLAALLLNAMFSGNTETETSKVPHCSINLSVHPQPSAKR